MTDEARALVERYHWFRIGCGRRIHAMREAGGLWTLCNLSGFKRAARFDVDKACERCLRKIEEASK